MIKVTCSDWTIEASDISEFKKQLLTYVRDLRNFIRDYAKLSEAEKPVLVGALLVALQNKGFRDGYATATTGKALASRMFGAIKEELEEAHIPEDKIKVIEQTLGSIVNHQVLLKGETLEDTPIYGIVERLDRHARPFIEGARHFNFDVLGLFYAEFLSYTAGDKKGLGIVLTPRHITDLISELVGLNLNSVVLDTCCGTGGFLIAAMAKMIEKAKGDSNIIKSIKSKQLVGVEQNPLMWTLAAFNMMLRGDGKSNLYQASCFSVSDALKALKCTVGLINPPYAQNGEGLSELDFIDHMLDQLVPGSLGAAIVPMSCAISGNGDIRRQLLTKHTLVATMSMPEQLFYPVGTNTIIMVFRAGQPHNPKVKTWFGYWKDDGHEITRTEGRKDKGNWSAIRTSWLEAYENKEVVPGLSVTRAVDAEMEWDAEAYLTPDYKNLRRDSLIQSIKNQIVFELLGSK